MPAGTIGAFMMVGFSIYGVLNVVLFAIGEAIADERGRGYLRLVRTTPLPSWAYLAGKLALAAVLCLTVVVLIGVAGTVTGAGVSVERWLAVTAVLVIGALAIAPLGFLIGFLARPHGASAVALLILFPLSLASGVFMPVDQLPGIVRDISMVTPTFHLAELARLAAGFSTTGLPATGSAWPHVAVIAAWSAAGFAAVALTYRRMVARQFA
jgi:ABC-2 type transport system permease protein